MIIKDGQLSEEWTKYITISHTKPIASNIYFVKEIMYMDIVIYTHISSIYLLYFLFFFCFYLGSVLLFLPIWFCFFIPIARVAYLMMVAGSVIRDNNGSNYVRTIITFRSISFLCSNHVVALSLHAGYIRLHLHH